MKKKLFKKVLVANRGEIAIRVMRACRELGIATAAVYSDADRNAIHVRYADEAHHIGGAPPIESYLQLERIVKVAHDCGADAIHPGYGFLSEKAAFPEACEAAGIRFIGPPASAMRALSSKLAARQLAIDHGVPVTCHVWLGAERRPPMHLPPRFGVARDEHDARPLKDRDVEVRGLLGLAVEPETGNDARDSRHAPESTQEPRSMDRLAVE